MKKIIIAVAVLLVTSSTLFVACKKDALPATKSNTPTSATVKKMDGEGQMSLSSYLDWVNSVGVLHNECMEHLYTITVASSDMSWRATPASIETFLRPYVEQFYQSKGVDITSGVNFTMSDLDVPLVLSSDATAIWNNMKAAAHSYIYNEIDEVQFSNICDAQKALSFNLNNVSERNNVGKACAVYESSIRYWQESWYQYNSLYNHELSRADLEFLSMRDAAGSVICGEIGGAIASYGTAAGLP